MEIGREEGRDVCVCRGRGGCSIDPGKEDSGMAVTTSEPEVYTCMSIHIGMELQKPLLLPDVGIPHYEYHLNCIVSIML